MAVATDVEARTGFIQEFAYARSIAAGIAPDVGDQYPQTFYLKIIVERQAVAYGRIVYVTVYAPDGLEGLQFIEKGYIAYVATVPHLVTVVEVLENGGVEVRMGIGKQADAHGLFVVDFVNTDGQITGGGNLDYGILEMFDPF